MLEKRYDIRTERRWRDWWLRAKIYSFKKKKPIFSIDTPPPTVSAGHLHIGHAMHYSQFEFVARYKRMRGFSVLFPMGFDDNGLPTEKFTEDELKIDARRIPREKFRVLCYKEASKVIERSMRPFFLDLGFSCQWPAYRTIDNQSRRVAQLSWLDLHRKGLLYRAKEPVLWCPKHQTALAQATVEDKERKTTLSYLYFTVDGKKISIATTRAELLASCVAVFVNPKDKRYKKLIGKRAAVPLFGLTVPILADDDVDMQFGTGVVMCCTFGDSADVVWWRKHKLPIRISLTVDGRLSKEAGKYAGLTIIEARKRIIADLRAAGELEKQEPLKQVVGVCWRCSTPVELIPTEQWFVKVLPFKAKLIKQGKRIRWFPDYYRKRYEDWIHNLNWDWCISRQRFYGVPIPVWYCAECRTVMLPTEKELPIDPLYDKPKRPCSCGSRKFSGERDVLDTWFTSSLTPELVVGWKSRLLPFSLRPQAHDIIRTWAFYTILKAYLHSGNIPWQDVMMGGHGLDPQGKAMHKSLGNVIWAPPIIKKYGADALRYWATSATLGEDLSFREEDVRRGSAILIKLWNSGRLISQFVSGRPKVLSKATLSAPDRWILAQLARTVKEYCGWFDVYEVSKARHCAELFFRHEFCDFYLEFVKYRLYAGADKAASSTLYTAFLYVLKLLAPVLPFITEVLYQEIFRRSEKEKSIHLTQIEDFKFPDPQAVKVGEALKEIIAAIRKFKQDRRLGLGEKIGRLTLRYPDVSVVKQLETEIKGIGRIAELRIRKGKLKIMS